jgi:glycosyltransferase involved in cell wall biosynthesis|tara:strand:- start:22 stop:258 length:237 start_codon:yes stop_codon:yes gene_type:complete
MINVGIAIPAYNEEKNVIKLINKINMLLKCYIIIVDDSENQNTKKLKKNNLFYIHRKMRLGRVSEVIEGLKELYKKKN